MTYDENNPSIPCPDLRTLFGGKFKTGRDPAFFVEHGRLSRSHDPWLLTVECKNGHIYPHGPDTLAASTNNRSTVSTALAALDCTAVVQDGDDGINATFHVRDFETVAEVMKPRKRRHGRPMTDEEKKRLADQGRAAIERLRATTHGPQTGLESTRGPEDVQTPTQPIQSPSLAPLHD